MTSNTHSSKFRGYIEIDENGNRTESNDDVENDDDEQQQAAFDSQEMEALMNGNKYVTAERPKRQKVCLRNLERRPGLEATRKVEGEFIYTDPWWELTVQIEHSDGGTYKKIKLPIKYRLRSDDKLDQNGEDGSVMYQFLHKCGVEDETKAIFMKYLRGQATKRGENVNFTLLRDVIDEAEEIEDPITRDQVCNQVKKILCKSVHYRVVKNAIDCPMLLELLPALLPKHLSSLLEGAATHQLMKLEDIIKEKPYLFGFSYQILQETKLYLPDVDHATFEKAGLLPQMDRKVRDALYIYYALKEMCNKYGHTYCWLSTQFSLQHYVPKGKKKKVIDSVPSLRWKLVLRFLREEMEVIKTDEAVNSRYRTCRRKDERIFLSKYYWAEINIARYIKSLMRKEQNFDQCRHCVDCLYERKLKGGEDSESEIHVEDTQTENGTSNDTASADNPSNWQQELLNRRSKKDQKNFKDDVDQLAAAKSVREQPFSVILGRGGCGKTHVVCEVMKEFCGASIVMAAPTGKAASNLRKKCGRNVKAKTLDQIRYSYAKAEDPTKWEYKDTDILVVDECSMVSVDLLSKTLKLLLDASNLKKLILMGDYRQLPSIDSGNILQDLFEYFKEKKDICVELKTNHRTESEHIVNCAIKISNGEMPDLNAAEEFRLIHLPTEAAYTRKKEILQELSEGDASDDVTSQFVTFTKNNFKALNDWCCPLYTGHEHKTPDQKSYLFLQGDKICPKRNANITDLDKKETCEVDWNRQERERRRKAQANEDEQGGVEEERKLPPPYMRRICNGEIFFIKEVREIIEPNGKRREVVTLTDLDESFNVLMSELKNQSNIRHAWARTIHTYQGSETDVVIYWLDKVFNQTRQHVYTAVTRGKKKVIIVGTEENLRFAVSKPPASRYTVLQERLVGIQVQSADGTPSRQRYATHGSSTLQPSTSDYTGLKSRPHLQNATDPSHPSTSKRWPLRSSREEKSMQPLISITDKQDHDPVNKVGDVMGSKGKERFNIKKNECNDSGTHPRVPDDTAMEGDTESFSEEMSEDWPEEKVKQLVQMEEEALLPEGKSNKRKHKLTESENTASENGMLSSAKDFAYKSRDSSKREKNHGDDPVLEEMGHSAGEASSNVNEDVAAVIDESIENNGGTNTNLDKPEGREAKLSKTKKAKWSKTKKIQRPENQPMITEFFKCKTLG
ncbi:DNA helicase B-like [Amphiura filiformis]|uniref:DNA helicase B-like n=1 Tax=Amphiura filiformis TaxID=82378 RepID=UPI003B210524